MFLTIPCVGLVKFIDVRKLCQEMSVMASGRWDGDAPEIVGSGGSGSF